MLGNDAAPGMISALAAVFMSVAGRENQRMSSPPRAEGLRERKKAKTRWTIQEHALRLFVQQGYEATTVEQVAEAAEVSPSTFFRYFPTKEDVVVQDAYGPLTIALFREVPPGTPLIGTLRQAVRTAFGGFTPPSSRRSPSGHDSSSRCPRCAPGSSRTPSTRTR